MNIVNFSITDPLARKINKVIKEWGFASKAEFFRFMAIDFINKHETKKWENDEMMKLYSQKIEKLANEKLANKKLPSIEKQLEDLL